MDKAKCEGIALRKAIENLSLFRKEKFAKFPGMLRDMAYRGRRDSFQFNHLRIQFFIKDKDGVFSLHWLVTNAISGEQQYFYNKDWVGKNGNIRWRDMAYKMYKV